MSYSCLTIYSVLSILQLYHVTTMNIQIIPHDFHMSYVASSPEVRIFTIFNEKRYPLCHYKFNIHVPFLILGISHQKEFTGSETYGVLLLSSQVSSDGRVLDWSAKGCGSNPIHAVLSAPGLANQ